MCWKGAWFIAGYSGGLDVSSVVNQATPGTSIAGVSVTPTNAADLVVGYGYPNTGTTGSITESAGFTNLFSNAFNSVGNALPNSTSALPYTPSWVTSSLLLLAQVAFPVRRYR